MNFLNKRLLTLVRTVEKPKYTHLRDALKQYTTKVVDATPKVADAAAVPKVEEEELKGMKRIVKFWKNVYRDYKDVAIDVYTECKEKPLKLLTYLTVGTSLTYCAQHNPDERCFKEQLVRSEEKLLSLGEPLRNPSSVYYVKWLHQSENEGTIRVLNCIFFSLLWLDNYDQRVAVYKAQCDALQPGLLDFHKRIIDIGFLDYWWVLENSMIDYDINNDNLPQELPQKNEKEEEKE
ncbi:mitochondrial import inner membrane translocase subunit Tim29 [Trichogramma pretiosum]|uniref:mitochondrial import inner membrane translocase subunit Tim29 n=1 Tax=Trichogramma pretiosum TaxID=7493 RepID=UPI0006C9DC33|nr:mitochondrial import inner membrane translocase subunit Tim29 [Trichogramma pretiosum]